VRTLGLIPARAGSKGIPGKNVRALFGKPLIAYSIEAAARARRINRIVVSTDDPAVAQTAQVWGAEAPFIRPAELATDTTPMLPVMQHAVRLLEESESYHDLICLLQPTSPMRTPDDIDECIGLLEQSGADTVVSVLPVPERYNPHWVFEPDDAGGLRLSTGEASPVPRRQDLPPAYHREGSIYIVRRDVLMDRNTLYGPRVVGYVMDAARSVNIDEPADWDAAVSLMSRSQNL
jgi:CMP-N-acetylneuraminic acid synthetase